MKLYTMAALAVATLPLAACLGSEDSSLPDSYDEASDIYDAAENDELTEASDELMSGTATLSGAIGISDIGDDEDLEAIGELSLTADFTNGEVTGSAYSFGIYDGDGELDTSLTGSLDIDGDISGTSMTADLTGTLSDDEEHDIDMDMEGTFYEYDGALAVAGDLSGTIDDEEYEGGFAALED
ncbi:hypothetical protein [Maritalea sp.]|uniref:hypothetical protein n=1 Tax=Maritalea sp. TaxID=2003361 RepID=UPI003EF850BE